METLAFIQIYRIPPEAILIPVIIAYLYVIFRWRKFGEDAFTWNHEYLSRACKIALPVWIAGFLSWSLPEVWQIAVLWVVAFIAIVLAMNYWASEDLLNAAIISLFICVAGLGTMFASIKFRAYLKDLRNAETSATVAPKIAQAFLRNPPSAVE